MSTETSWKGIIIGSLSTLVVTVVSGIIIYYTTQFPGQNPTEHLIYRVGVPIAFESARNKISFTQIQVRNAGSAEANNVLIGIEFPEKTKLVDNKVTSSSDPTETYSSTVENERYLRVKVPVLTPDEIATITILTDSTDDKIPNVGVKSDKSTGHESLTGVLVSEAEIDLYSIRRVYWQVGLLLALLVLVSLFVRRLRKIFPNFRSVNNTAFVYLHTGLVDKAYELLSDNISKAGAEPVMLSNFGLALALKGDADHSQKLFYAANFWANANNHEKAVILFNKALSFFWQGEQSKGVQDLRKSLDLSKPAIIHYLKFSALVATLRVRHPDLHSLLDEIGVSRDEQKNL